MRISGIIVSLLFYACLLAASARISPVFGQSCTGTVRPSINISTSSATSCIGKTVLFTATSTNSGNNPSYQWKVNGMDVGTNSDTLAISTLQNNDVVSCVLTADPMFTCASPSSVTSYGIAVTVSASPSPSIQIAASANDICPGTPITFQATTQNTSAVLSYQWILNGDRMVSDSNAFSSSSLVNNDNILCILTDSSACYAGPDTSNVVVMTVKTFPVVTVSPADTFVSPGSRVSLNALVPGSIVSYQWLPADSLNNAFSLSPLTHAIYASTNFFFDAVDSDGCSLSKEITIGVLRNINMPNAFTPNGDGINDVFRIPPNSHVDLREFSIYNRWGNKIFSTADVSQGWDGTVSGRKQDAGAYIYVVLVTGHSVYKGTFLLIR